MFGKKKKIDLRAVEFLEYPLLNIGRSGVEEGGKVEDFCGDSDFEQGSLIN